MKFIIPLLLALCLFTSPARAAMPGACAPAVACPDGSYPPRTGNTCHTERCPDGSLPNPLTANMPHIPDAVFQDALLLFGFLCFILSGAHPLEGLRWRRQARRVTGTLNRLDMRGESVGDLYYPVYRYSLGDGKEYEGLTDRFYVRKDKKHLQVGSTHEILVFPGRPTVVREADARIFDAADVLFLCFGAFLACEGARVYPPTQPSYYYIASGIALFFALLTANVFRPDTRRPPPGSALTVEEKAAGGKELHPPLSAPGRILFGAGVVVTVLYVMNHI
ncbi:MAG: hypothetical protein GC185_11635 [Alphaproteobacteria bacterium]|nr:hypothetical protein [Alphaproteobacteria bacterium]